MRSWLVVSSLALVATAAPSAARAELGGGVLKIEIKTPSDPADDPGSIAEADYITPTADARLRYFNLARCVCDDQTTDQNYHARVSWATVPTTSVAGTQLLVYTGSGCETGTQLERDGKCTQLDPIADAADVQQVVKRFDGLRALLTPASTSAGCDPSVTASALGIYSSTDGGATLTAEKVEAIMPVDMRAPEAPDTVTVSAEEGQITLGWDRISSGAEDFEFFQALCALAATSAPAHDEPTDEPLFDTTQSVCRTSVSEYMGATIENDADIVGTAVDYATLPEGLADLDATFVCGKSAGSAQSITLRSLSNGVAYVVVLVAMDKAGNYTARYVPKTVTPQPVTDFWEDLNEENPELEGGLCLVESTYGAGGGGIYGALRAWRDELQQSELGRWLVARYYGWGAPVAAAARESVIVRAAVAVVMLPLIAVALAWHALGLPLLLALLAALVWWRRRRRRSGGLGFSRARLKLALAAALVLAPSLATAQSVTPYWDDDLATSDDTSSGPKWHFGFRLGPFRPSIDDERFASPGPYERMFGDGGWLPAFDLHRVFGTRAGQIGAGVSVGYFGKTADAFLPGTMDRAEGNETSLRIVPFELTAIWRGSQLHDNWGIPVIPYARGGLGYSLWWVRRPDGELAKACPPDLTNCDRAIGGSLGLVGAAGLAIRAEGIDPDAARSMRDSGLDHAGFYAEVEMAWVDGFGNANKLSLGDTTWFAGIDFEF